jgi:ketosteroid isomerase-like protein
MQAQAHKVTSEFNTQQLAATLSTGLRGFEAFKRGLATGAWSEFLMLLTDDFEMYFPVGQYKGCHQGKDKAQEFFRYVSQVYNEGLHVVELLRLTANEQTVVFEFRDEGLLRGEMYRNRVTVSWDIRDGKIARYREYFGSDGKSN